MGKARSFSWQPLWGALRNTGTAVLITGVIQGILMPEAVKPALVLCAVGTTIIMISCYFGD